MPRPVIRWFISENLIWFSHLIHLLSTACEGGDCLVVTAGDCTSCISLPTMCATRGSTTSLLRALLRSFMDSDYVCTLANSCVGQMYIRIVTCNACIVYTAQLCRGCRLRESRTDAIMPNFCRAQWAGRRDYLMKARWDSFFYENMNYGRFEIDLQNYFEYKIAIVCHHEIIVTEIVEIINY